MKPLPIVYIAPIKTLTSLPICKFSSARRWFISSRRWVATVFDIIFSFRMRASFFQFGKHYSYVAFGETPFYQNCYQFRTLSLTYVRGGGPYPSGYSLPLLCSAFLLPLALVFALSVALWRPVSSLLLSFAGDALSSVVRPALLSKF